MLVTSIGSLPFLEVDRAIDLVFECCPEVPFWPQLPARSSDENMYTQFLENVPGMTKHPIDERAAKVHVNTQETKGIERFYEDFYDEKLDEFSISNKAAPGLFRLLDKLEESRRNHADGHVKFVKGQLTGPFTLGLGLKDEHGKSIIYNTPYFDIIKKALHMKAKWMIREIKQRSRKEAVIFFDEPAMVSFGSAFVSISKEEVLSLINEVAGGLDATVGIHCCGNTDWSVLLKAGIDIVNYDAFAFMDTIFYFKDELTAFLNRGGVVSPGIIPSKSDNIAHMNRNLIADSLIEFVSRIRSHKEDFSPANLWITPSCGLGSVTEQEAKRALNELREVAKVAESYYQK